MLVPLILAGGSGTRLEPISTPEHPKPFLDLLDCGYTLFELTLLRAKCASDVPPIILASKHHLAHVQLSLNKLSLQAHILLEPCGRNTAPAIACGALMAKSLYGEECLLLTLAADHYIEDQSYFAQRITDAVHLANNHQLVLFGVKPTYPETGYGYIEIDKKMGIVAFHEKPNQEKATRYLETGQHLWNSGFFLFPLRTLLEEIQRYAPDIMYLSQDAYQGHTPLSKAVYLLSEHLNKVTSLSIDKAVLELSQKLALCEYQQTWCDLGSWQALYNIWPKDPYMIAHNKNLGISLIPNARYSRFELIQNGTKLAHV